MTAREILDKTLKIMGITDNEGNPVISKRVKQKAISLINLVYADLHTVAGSGDFVPVESLSDNINLPLKVLLETFIYGLAMNIAFSESDSDSQQYFSILYNKKRASINRKSNIVDDIPRSVDL